MVVVGADMKSEKTAKSMGNDAGNPTLGASLLVVSLGGCVAGEAGLTASPSSAPVLAGTATL